MKERIVSLCLLAAVLLLFCACTEDYTAYAQEITGTWRTTEDESRYEVFAFSADGTGSYSVIVSGEEALSFDFSYRLEGNVLIRTAAGEEVRHTVRIEGDTLTLTAGKSSVVLKKDIDKA